MALPDRFEQVGIVVGSAFLLSLPGNALAIALFDPATPWPTVALGVVPGIVVGLLLAAGRLPMTYREVWAFSLSSVAFTLAFWTVFGASPPSSDRGVAVGAWLVAVAAGAVVARTRPLHRIRERLLVA